VKVMRIVMTYQIYFFRANTPLSACINQGPGGISLLSTNLHEQTARLGQA